MKGQKFGGRQRGTPNKATASVKELADAYTEEALRTLAGIMRNPKAPPQARVSAANALLDRGHGKAPQALAVELGADKSLAMLIADALGVMTEEIPNKNDLGPAHGTDA